ncbi:MAG TPA: methyltransferase domain-containing protein [Candidatus Limnocylindria bacterium]|nr:methyltransferase domain-containing protein [Candidatus Limnocylindria bacterium]
MATGNDFTYVGGELGLFSHATNWKRYWSKKFAAHLSGSVLEVGAGIGTNTVLLRPSTTGKWTCLEPDGRLVDELKSVLARNRFDLSCRIIEGTIAALPPGENFDTIIYVDVLEHIPDDGAELTRAADRLRPKGKVVVLSPAHQWLFSEFDQSIGHCRRYSKRTLLAATPKTLQPVKCFYLDSCGLFASLANRVLLRQSMPTLKQILFWDRTIVPASRVLDRLLFYGVGKSVIGIWERKDA